MRFKKPTAQKFPSTPRADTAERDNAAAHTATAYTTHPNAAPNTADTATSTCRATHSLLNAEKLPQALCVCLGGAAGVLARFCVCENLGYAAATILLCNISGTFLMGFASRLRGKLGKNTTAFLTAGFCGGFTVFAGVAKFAAQKLASGEFDICALDILSNLAFCILAAFLGYKLGGAFTRTSQHSPTAPEK